MKRFFVVGKVSEPGEGPKYAVCDGHPNLKNSRTKNMMQKTIFSYVLVRIFPACIFFLNVFETWPLFPAQFETKSPLYYFRYAGIWLGEIVGVSDP